MLHQILRDAKHTMRWLRKSPAFAAAAIGTLSVGIGLTTGVFSVVNAALLRPLPYFDADRLTLVASTRSGDEISVSYPDFEDWAAQSRRLHDWAAYSGTNGNLTGSGEAERLRGAAVTPGLFNTLRVTPLHGRVLQPADHDARARVIVLSHGLWQRRFAGDPRVVGSAIVLNGEPYTVVGVMPLGFTFPAGLVYDAAEYWVPVGTAIRAATLTNRDEHPGLVVIARLRAGATLNEARTEMKGIAERLRRAYPQSNANSSVELSSALDALVGNVRNVLLVLLGAVGLILLIACANVASLLLARASTRRRELAIRSSLGASGRVLAQQLLVESAVLSLIGAAGGIAVAWLITRSAPAFAPDLPRVSEARVDGRVLSFALVAALVNALVFGCVPALQVLGARLDPWLRERSFGGRGRRLRGAVVAGEIALSLMLLVAAGVLVKSLQNVLTRQRGINPAQVLTFDLRLPESTYAEPEPIANFYTQLERRIAALPGIQSVGAISVLPFSGYGNQSGMTEAGGDPMHTVRTDVNAVTPGYFATMRIPLLRGRTFQASDDANAPTVAIVDETFARRFWPNEDAIGKRVEGWGFRQLTVVGVVRHVPNYGVTAESREELYVPHAQRAYTRMNVVVRAAGDPLATMPALRRTLAELDPRLPFYNARLMETVVGQTVATPRVAALISSAFAIIAVLLAMLGTYGVMTFAVSQRTNEFGVRTALGARGTQLLGLVLREALALGSVGALVGTAGALFAANALEKIVFGVSARDALVFALAPAVVLLCALAATLIPALRAARVQPLIAIRDG